MNGLLLSHENLTMNLSSKNTRTSNDHNYHRDKYGDSTHTGTKSIYHYNCEVLIKLSMTPAQCTSYKKHRKSLSAMVSRPQKDHPSSHTTYSWLKTAEMHERLHNVHAELCKAYQITIVTPGEEKYQRSVKRAYIWIQI